MDAFSFKLLLFLIILFFLVLIFIVNAALRSAFPFFLQRKRVAFYAPLRTLIEAFAREQNCTVLVGDMRSKGGVARLKKYLRPGMPWSNVQPFVPLLEIDEKTRNQYRPVFILRRAIDGLEIRLFIFPERMHADGNFHGVAYAVASIPPTNHWFKLYPETLLGESGSDHDLESNAFNAKHTLTGSNPMLLTEVFDPVLMERLNAKGTATYLARVHRGVIEFAEAGALQHTLFTEVLQLFHIFETRFLKAYQSYPEPVKK